MRKYVAVVAGVATVLSLAACGNGSGGGADDSARASQMYTWVSNDLDRQQWQSFIDGVKQGDPEFNLTMEGPAFKEYWTLVKTRMSANDAPCIITTQGARAQEMAGLLAPLDDLAKEAGVDLTKYNKGMMDGLTVDGTVRGVPYDAEPMFLYFNKDMFKAAGLQEPGLSYTTEQFLSDAKALTKDGQHGIAVSSILPYPYLTAAFASGHEPVVDGQLKLDDPGFVASMQSTFDLVAKEKVALPPSPADTDEQPRSAFFTGKVAMIVDGPWSYQAIKDGAKFDVGIAVPWSDSGKSIGLLQGSAFGIAQSCPDKKAAFENIKKLTSSEVLSYVTEKRGIVPSLEESMDAWSKGKDEVDVQVMRELVTNGRALQTTPAWNQVETRFAQFASEGARGNKTAQDILSDIQASAGR